MSTRTKALSAIFIASVLWGSAGVVAKNLLVYFDPYVIALLRTIIASLFILPLFLHQKHHPIQNILKEVVPISILTAINLTLYYIGMEKTTVNASAVMYAATPLVVTMISSFTIQEKISVKKFFGILLGFIGVLSFLILPNFGNSKIGFGTPLGNVILLIAVISWASYIVGSRYLTNIKHYHPIFVTSISMFTSLIFLLIVNLFVQHHIDRQALTNPTVILNFLYLGLFVTVITYVLFQWAIQQLSSTTASLTNYLQPVFAFFFAWIFLGEKITPIFLCGNLLVLTGVFIVTGDRMLHHVRNLKSRLQNGSTPLDI